MLTLKIPDLDKFPPPSNLNPQRVEGNGNVRVAVLKELKDIFKKHRNGAGN